MEINELAAELKKMAAEGAPQSRKTAMIHLFGIKYADELWDKNLKAIVDLAGLDWSYRDEVSKGRALAEYVDVNPQYR